MLSGDITTLARNENKRTYLSIVHSFSKPLLSTYQLCDPMIGSRDSSESNLPDETDFPLPPQVSHYPLTLRESE